MCRLQEDPDKVTGLEAVATCVAALVPRLVALDISSNPALLGTGVVAVCRALEGCRTLRYLRLADLKLGAKGAHSLPVCSTLSTYNTIILRYQRSLSCFTVFMTMACAPFQPSRGWLHPWDPWPCRSYDRLS